MSPFGGNINVNVGYPDFDQDGFGDLFSGYHGGLAIAYGQAGGTFGPFQVLLTGSVSRIFGASSMFDADLDGDLDLVVVERGGPVELIWLYHGDGARGVNSPASLTLHPSVPLFGSNSHQIFPSSASTGVRPTLMVMTLSVGSVAYEYTLSAIVYNPATGQWEPQAIGMVSSGPYLSVEPIGYPLGDFDGDGVTDWLWVVRSLIGQGQAPTHLGIVRGLAQAPWFDVNTRFFAFPAPSTYAYIANFDDVNQDGCSDVALWGFHDRLTPVIGAITWFGDRSRILRDTPVYTNIPTAGPNGGFSMPQTSRQTFGYRLGDFADYDMDGVRDLLYRVEVWTPRPPNSYSLVGRMLDFHRGKRDGTFSPAMRLSDPSLDVRDVARYDVDGDGDLDVVDFFLIPGQPQVSINDSISGFGWPAANGMTPRIGRGVAFLGNSDFFIDVEGAPPSSAAVLAVGTRPAVGGGPIGIDLSSLLWAPGAIGPTQTTAAGGARAKLPIPADPALAGLGLYFQWAVASPNASGYALTPTAKVVFWP